MISHFILFWPQLLNRCTFFNFAFTGNPHFPCSSNRHQYWPYLWPYQGRPLWPLWPFYWNWPLWHELIWPQISVLRDHLFCSRPRPRLVLISIFFQDQYQDLSWFQFSFKTNTKTSLEMEIFSRPIPRLVLILETIQDQYQESWL